MKHGKAGNQVSEYPPLLSTTIFYPPRASEYKDLTCTGCMSPSLSFFCVCVVRRIQERWDSNKRLLCNLKCKEMMLSW